MKENSREKIIYFAKKCLGRPYKYGAKPSEAPKIFDCSSFTQYIYKKIGIKLPRTAIDQAHSGREIEPKKENLKAGDLIFMRGAVRHYDEKFPQGIGHVAMHIGNDEIIQAKYKKNKDGSDGGQVQINKVEKVLNSKNLVIAKRII
jgi:peptidoglycan endopeptidase LytE